MISNQSKDQKTTNILSETLIPLNSAAAPTPSLVCIGQNLSLVQKSGQINLASVFISPNGQVAFVLSERPTSQEIPSIVAKLMSLGYDQLDSIASDYTHRTRGQAYRIIDTMAAHGHLTFSNSKDLISNTNQCMKKGAFQLFCVDRSSR